MEYKTIFVTFTSNRAYVENYYEWERHEMYSYPSF